MTKKILHYVPTWGTATETFIRNLLSDLKDEGINNNISCKLDVSNSSNVHVISRFSPRFERIFNSISYRIPIRWLNINNKKLNKLLDDDLTLVHAHFGEGGWDMAYKLVEKEKVKYPCVISLHGTDTTRLPNRSYNYRRKIYELSKCSGVMFTVPSSFLKKEAINNLNINPKKIHIVGNSYNESFLNCSSERSEKIKFVNIARFVDWKNQQQLINAFNEFLKEVSNAELILIGDGVEKENCINQVKSLGIESHVRFHGSIKHSEVAKILSENCIYIQPSRRNKATGEAESFGVVILEALASNCKVITSNTGGMQEVLSEFNNCSDGVYIYNIDDDEDLLHGMKLLTSEKVILNQKKRIKTLDKYSKKNVCSAYQHVYSCAIKEFNNV